jgi:hypothetical protein
MVRQHPVESARSHCANGRHFDAAKLDRLDRWFSILKKNGMYMTWSIFYHHVVLPTRPIRTSLSHNSGGGKDTYGSTFIEEYQIRSGVRLPAAEPRQPHGPGLQGRSRPGHRRARNEDSVFSTTPGDAFGGDSRTAT